MGRFAKLTALAIKTLNKPGRYCDGGGLYIQVTKSGTKSWLYRFMIRKRQYEMGLGSAGTISLSEARDRASKARHQLANGINPLEAKAQAAREQAVKIARSATFSDCAQSLMKSMGGPHGKWKNAKHCGQWQSTLETYAYPVIGTIPVDQVDTAMVLKILEPIWRTKTETASRVRGRVETILDYATAHSLRSGDNPARWRGHLKRLLPEPREISPVKHLSAMAIADVGQFCKELRAKQSLTARALELLILTVLRPGELVGARWQEIDLVKSVWIVPANRMKKKIEHRVPLTARAIELLGILSKNPDSDYVFLGNNKFKPMTTSSLLKLVKEMRPDLQLTTHGFRSTFKDWAAEYTEFSNEVSEMALAHRVSNKVEAAYRRGDLFPKRKHMMSDWNDFCAVVQPNEFSVLEFPTRLA